ncbi:MAG: hypothetical protein HQ523_02315 [Lentisphaerae bacterium]|nr:hypothetical protein [Lentisphaerota bacterium]
MKTGSTKQDGNIAISLPGRLPLSCIVVFLWVAAYNMYTGRVMLVGYPAWGTLALLALVLIALPRRSDWSYWRQWRSRFAWCTAVSLALLAMLTLSERTIFIQHDVPSFLVRIVASLTTLLRFEAIPASGEVAIWTDLGWRRIACHAESFGVEYGLAALLWCVCFCALLRSPLRRLRFAVTVVCILLAYQCLRFTLAAVLYAETSWSGILWNPIVMCLSQLPLAAILNRVGVKYTARCNASEAQPQRIALSRMEKYANPLGFAALSAGLALLVIAFWYKPLGVQQFGRVLIDDAHSNWEWSTPFERHSFGEKATYGYGSLRALLQRYWPTDVNESTSLDSIDLSLYQVVILKTPTKPYTPSEIDAVLEFIHAGGGVWMIGDHDNLFGMGQYLNSM